METISYFEQRSSTYDLGFSSRYSLPYNAHEDLFRPPPQTPSLYHLELEKQLAALNRIQPEFIFFHKIITRFNCATEPSATSLIIRPGLWPLETRMEVLKAMRIVRERWLSQLDAKFLPPMWRGYCKASIPLLVMPWKRFLLGIDFIDREMRCERHRIRRELADAAVYEWCTPCP